MQTLDRRVQVLFDADRYAALEEWAITEKRSVGSLIRDAVDASLAARVPGRRAAFMRLMQQVEEHSDLGPPPTLAEWQAVKNSTAEALDWIP
jgi:hypothetical protein